MENIMKALRNDVGYERKSVSETVITEAIDDVKPKKSSSRMNSLGYKIASKMFELFIWMKNNYALIIINSPNIFKMYFSKYLWINNLFSFWEILLS